MKLPIGIRIPVPIPEVLSSIFRVNPLTGETRGDLLLTFQQIPNTWTQQRPREASPTGKSGIGIATYSQAPQHISLVRRKTVLPARPNEQIGHLKTTGSINPYDAVTKNRSPKLNVKYQP